MCTSFIGIPCYFHVISDYFSGLLGNITSVVLEGGQFKIFLVWEVSIFPTGTGFGFSWSFGRESQLS